MWSSFLVIEEGAELTVILRMECDFSSFVELAESVLCLNSDCTTSDKG